MRLVALAALSSLSWVGCVNSRREVPEVSGTAHVHTYASPPSGIRANAYLVQTSDSIVVIDVTLTVSDARRLRAKVDSIGKPLAAVLLTHGHPDHYNGLTELIAGLPAVPIYATAGVLGVIKEGDARKETQWKGTFGDEWPMRRTFPNRTVADGETITVDGVRFTVHDIGPGESHHDAYWTALDGSGEIAFVGDLVFNGEHAYVSDGHTTEWLANLDRLRAPLSGKRLYPGHGPPGGSELLGAQQQYLSTYRQEIVRLAVGRQQLSESEKAALTSRMATYLPGGQLTFLISNGADAVANELAKAASQAPGTQR